MLTHSTVPRLCIVVLRTLRMPTVWLAGTAPDSALHLAKIGKQKGKNLFDDARSPLGITYKQTLAMRALALQILIQNHEQTLQMATKKMKKNSIFHQLFTLMQLTQGSEEKKKIKGSNSRLDAKVHLQQFKETCSHTSEIGFRSQSL